MIVSPNKGVFFLATALMCSASLYGAELSSPSSDPLTRIFVGEPNRLTLPPGFPDGPGTSEVALDQVACTAPLQPNAIIAEAPLQKASASADEEKCEREDNPEPGALVLPGRLSAADENLPTSLSPTSVSTAAQSH